MQSMHWSYHGKNVTQEISQFQQTCQQQETRYNQHLQALTKNQPTTSGPSKLTTSSSLWRLALPVTISAHLEVFGDKSEELVLGVRLVRPFPTLPSPWCSERGNIHFRRSSVRNYWTLPQLDYVDNRFAVLGSVIARSDPIAIYSDPGFYGHPVELKKVNDSMLLGFKVSVAERTVTYQCPNQQQIRDIASAGSIRLRLSGLKSRAHLIRKYSFPPSAIEPIVTSACTVVCTAGFSPSEVYLAVGLRWSQKMVSATYGLGVWVKPCSKGRFVFCDFCCAVFQANDQNRGTAWLVAVAVQRRGLLQVTEMDSGRRIHVPVLKCRTFCSIFFYHHGKVAKPETTHVDYGNIRPSREFSRYSKELQKTNDDMRSCKCVCVYAAVPVSASFVLQTNTGKCFAQAL